MKQDKFLNDRGVALLIVLLVTALLIALIFEFAYGTRVSLRAAINFRDSERAYYLARAGIKAFINPKYGGTLREIMSPGEWYPISAIGEGDTAIMIKWEDESGKIKITDIKKDSVTLTIVRALFETLKGLDTAVVNRIAEDPNSDFSNVSLLSELHQYMSDEDFNKVSDSLTVAPVSLNKVTINVNTASTDVLQSLGINAQDVKRIIEERQTTPYTDADLSSTGRLSRIVATLQDNFRVNPLTTKSIGYYKIFGYATVGGYTRRVEAVVNGSNTSYWRVL